MSHPLELQHIPIDPNWLAEIERSRQRILAAFGIIPEPEPMLPREPNNVSSHQAQRLAHALY